MKEYNLDFFLAKGWVFALIQEGKVLYKSKNHGLKPLIFCVKKYKTQMRGAVVFDKVVGRAAALLLIYGGVKEVLTPLISQGALNLFCKNKIKVSYIKKIKHILNKQRNDLCPMEKMSHKKLPAEFIRRVAEVCKKQPSLYTNYTKNYKR